ENMQIEMDEGVHPFWESGGPLLFRQANNSLKRPLFQRLRRVWGIFFQYDRISLTCVANFSGWTVKRTVSSYTAQKCQHGWAIPSDNSCTIEDAYPADSGEYWCESDHGECSNKVNISRQWRKLQYVNQDGVLN
uniref:Ig-like domain-containing protein n=1 Tax=Cyprinodon variegatus TaxID=28743 RepID=A0A3Q2DUR4_CYPVA